MVVRPVSIVDSRVPAFISTNNVVSSGGSNGGEEDEEAKEDEPGHHFTVTCLVLGYFLFLDSKELVSEDDKEHLFYST